MQTFYSSESSALGKQALGSRSHPFGFLNICGIDCKHMETFSYIYFHIFTFQLSHVKIECFCLPKQQEVTLNTINLI
jgi:hypothetical protein